MNKQAKMSKTKRMGRSHSYDTKLVRIRTENNGLGWLKSLIVLLAIAVQLAAMIALYIFVINVFNWYVAVSLALSIISCIHVLSTNKNGQSKAAWILFLLVGFSIGYIMYYLSDVKVFFGRPKKRYARIYKETEKYKQEQPPVVTSEATKGVSGYLDRVGGFETYDGTDLKYFPSGAQLFDDVLETLKSAEKFVFIEFFIIADGILLERVLGVLEEKARSGVDVRMIYDDLGSHRVLKRRTKKRVKKAGIKMMPYNRLTPRFTVSLNYRDHRKIIVVDGKTAYTGGSNLADEYVNEKRMHGYWKDNGLRLDGRAVDGFTLMFLRQWDFITKAQSHDYTPFLNLCEKTDSRAAVVPYADGLDYEAAIGKGVYSQVIAAAKEKLWIMTPYLVPDETIMDELAGKALSGADVRLILPEVPDKPYVYAVSYDNALRLMDAGVKVYLMKNSFVHSKIMLTENGAVIGSINLDLRSFYQQFECAVYTDSAAVISDVAADFETTFADSRLLEEKDKKRSLIKRILTGLLRIVAPLM